MQTSGQFTVLREILGRSGETIKHGILTPPQPSWLKIASLMLFSCSSCCLVEVVAFGWAVAAGGLPAEVEVVG
jgi:hypothetical protein